ncbi:hypothetical protein CYPRO_1804 [Cyclonatronum proteinivorum]|uniref:Phosphoglycolate phosphatase n=1 Tax=Cyclonatronum proteinivorum TaxID=1457365 RepID=A0A345UKQ2_9BACT|nr:HAD-IIB family hydrolase [Cyclonatronum proteinivorum]AXJ01054.1 hypothetical protein CYPRO_1804 [Cyclonatronum proteinivorum]
MTSLFVLDIDGCITMPFQTPDWQALTRLRELNDLSRLRPEIPALSICSGRPQPYVEAVGQWLGMYKPLIFESGGGMFDPRDVSLHWPESLTPEREQIIQEIREWVAADIIATHEGAVSEFTKRTDVGIIHPHESAIIKMYEKVCARIAADYPDFEVHRTEISINIIMKGANKGSGLRWLSQLCDVPLSDIAYIGDSSGDIPALEIAGTGFTPANGIGTLKKMAGVHTTKGKATEGVIEAYHHIIERNKS